jgi:hypothetical protein
MDTRIARAARVAEEDEALRARLAAQAGFDEQMVEAIHAIKPPDGFRARLGLASSRGLRKHARHPAILCAIAGALLIIGFLVYLEMDRRASFPGKENVESMIDSLDRMSGMELESAHGPVSGLTDWFYMRGFEGLELPPDLAALPAVGVRTFSQGSHTICQLAIDRQASILTIFHASEFGVFLDSDADWKYFDHGEWSAAIRRRGDICTVITLRGSRADIEELIHSLTP